VAEDLGGVVIKVNSEIDVVARDEAFKD
jgi:translation elongation factor EF-Ts